MRSGSSVGFAELKSFVPQGEEREARTGNAAERQEGWPDVMTWPGLGDKTGIVACILVNPGRKDTSSHTANKKSMVLPKVFSGHAVRQVHRASPQLLG